MFNLNFSSLLCCCKFSKFTVFLLKLMEAALFKKLSMLEDKDLAASLDSCHSMSDDDACSTLHSSVKGLSYQLLRVLIKS